MLFRCAALAMVVAALLFSAGDTEVAASAAIRLDKLADKCPIALASEFRLLGAEVLQARHPDTSRKLVDITLEQLRAGKMPNATAPVIRSLAVVAPKDAIALVPEIWPASRESLIVSLASRKAPETLPFFRETLAGCSFENLQPMRAWALVSLASGIAPLSADDAAGLYERVLTAVSAPDYGEKASPRITATFAVGSETIATTNSRDTLLVAAGARLKALAPGRAEKFATLLSPWKLAGPALTRSINMGIAAAAAQPKPGAAEVTAIRQRLSQFRGMATDADRAAAAIDVAGAIAKLPDATDRLSLARGLSSLSTEGDLGRAALTAVAKALGDALNDSPSGAADFIELAKYIRYEHIAAPNTDAALDAASALLALREITQQENGFRLTSLDGKTYTLDALHGKVVLLNFWATWCPPCRKEMPDMEKLAGAYPKDLVVLAVSDEDREVVEGYLKKTPYTFPILLDPGAKIAAAFSVEGIPKSFIFDRKGKLVAQAVDMRTERQFRELLRDAGLL